MGEAEDAGGGSIWQQPIRPVEQDTVMLFGHPVRAVRLPDGRIAAVFSDMTRALDVVRSRQARRVRDDETIGDQLLPAIIREEDGTEAPGEVLTAWAIPLWLLGIQPSRLAPEKRPTVLAFKREAADVLYQHFSQRQSGQDALSLAAPTSVVEATPTAPTAPPTPGEAPTIAPDASPEERRGWRQLMRDWLDRLDEFDDWRAQTDVRLTTVEGRVEGVEVQVGELAAIIPDIVARLAEQPLIATHLAAVQQGVNVIHDGQGLSHERIYHELHQAFHVGRYDQIPERRWTEVVAWFRPRTAAARDAGQRRGRQAQHDPFADDAPAQGSLF